MGSSASLLYSLAPGLIAKDPMELRDVQHLQSSVARELGGSHVERIAVRRIVQRAIIHPALRAFMPVQQVIMVDVPVDEVPVDVALQPWERPCQL